MRSVSIHKAKKHFSRLIGLAVLGEPFIITKGGKPLVKVTAMETNVAGPTGRLGFLSGELSVPAEFNTLGSLEIEQAFSGTASETNPRPVQGT